MGKPAVLLTTEGTYPCYAGGVSVWCDYLVRYLNDMDFHVFALIHSPSKRMQFACPTNVSSCVLHPMWGTEEPGCFQQGWSETQRRRIRTTGAAISGCLPHFRTTLQNVLSEDSDPEALARGLFGLHEYFQKCDYAASMGSPAAWETFLASVSESDLPLNLEEATHCMRWLQRYLSLLAVRYPSVDVVHSSMAGLAGVPGVLCKIGQASSYVLTEHGIYLRELYLSLAKSEYSDMCRQFLVRFYAAIARMNYHFADAITSLGEYNRQWQIRFGAPARKIRTIPNGIDPAKFRPQRREPGSRPTVLSMARIFSLKGIDVLIRAAAQVRASIPAVQFQILGEVADHDYYAECLRLVRELKLEETVRFGETRDPASAYGGADVFCLPSRSEGLPFAVIEAMMCGCPVVAADVGNVADLLDTTGLTFTPNDADGLAAALLQLLSGEDAKHRRESLGQAAAARANRYFTVAQFSARFRELYKELTDAQVAAVLSRAAG